MGSEVGTPLDNGLGWQKKSRGKQMRFSAHVPRAAVLKMLFAAKPVP